MNDKRSISAKDLLPAKVIAIGLLAGATLFFAVVLLLMQIKGAQKDSAIDSEILPLLTVISLSMCLVLNCISPIIQKLLVKSAIARSGENSNPIAAYQTGMIVRYAMAEGPAFFGLVSLLMGVADGNFPSYLWLNTLPLGVLYLVVFLTFPTKNYVEEKINMSYN